jgi:hypothetical protein
MNFISPIVALHSHTRTMAASAALAHPGVRWITFGWTAFLTENVVLSDNRDWVIDRIGAERYHQLYNTLSLLANASLAFGYFRYGRRAGPTVANFDATAPMRQARQLILSLR